MKKSLTRAAGWPWLAGLLLAAPFAAVMSTCDSFLLMVSSAVVRDVYQRNINPNTCYLCPQSIHLEGEGTRLQKSRAYA